MKFYKETEFQETEMGEIPREWKLEKLGYLVNYIKGKKPRKLYNEKISENLVPYLTAEYMRGLETPNWCNPQEGKELVKVKEEDIIMIWDGSYAGHVFIGFNGILASTMIKIVPKQEINEKFLYYFLAKNLQAFRVTTTGTGIPHVDKRVFNDFLVPLPPIKEQQTIAGILLTVDSAIKHVDNLVAKLNNLKKALMNELLTGRIRIREQNGKFTFYTETDFQETEIGKIPKEWKVVKLGKVVEVWDKYRIPVKENERKPGPFPYCGANGIIDYVDGYTHDGEFVLLAEDGGFFGRFEKSAYIMRGKFWANNHVHVLKVIKETIFSEFLMYYLNFTDLTPFITGSTRPKLNLKVMKEIPIALPPLIEQMKIADILLTVDRTIELYYKEKDVLKNLKMGLMDMLLTGRVRVSED
jgi:type I restriction enzyme S subunit